MLNVIKIGKRLSKPEPKRTVCKTVWGTVNQLGSLIFAQLAVTLSTALVHVVQKVGYPKPLWAE